MEYHGKLNELRMGVKPDEPPVKPEALVLWEQSNKLGLPVWDGGVKAQPHLWLLEAKVVEDVETIMAIARAREAGQDDANLQL
jgi:hypothetical protein